ncbi:MAG: radical SAM protein [Lachnospiraceae bacterium]|nr:radical SAM protein [Lachnospiraceae bacterium]
MEKTKIKVLLIHPEISRTKYNFVGVIENECLELEYISALLKQEGYQVLLYDGQVEKISVKTVLKEQNPDVVYVCGRTRQENFMLEYCREAKSQNPATITMIGGLHAQLCYERMYDDGVDYIFTTYNIFSIWEVLENHFRGKNTPLQRIKGICYKQDGKWGYVAGEPFDLKELPWPDRTYFYEHPQNYRYLELEHAAWVRTSLSCPYNCKFCHRNRMNLGHYVCRDIEDVVEEIASIQATNIYIMDDDFLFNEERLRRFIILIREKDIRKNYICYGRADFIAQNRELMAELKSIGLYYVLVGLETITDEQLKEYNKRSDLQNNITSIEICHDLGIHLMGMFIIDLDYTPKDFSNLYKWIKAQGLRHVAISIFTPEMGLETYEAYRERLITDNPSHWDYLHVVAKPDNMSVKRYYFHYYILLIKLFLKGKRDGVYDFIDYGDYIRSFIRNIFVSKRSRDDE